MIKIEQIDAGQRGGLVRQQRRADAAIAEQGPTDSQRGLQPGYLTQLKPSIARASSRSLSVT